jgi:hypothetical protein
MMGGDPPEPPGPPPPVDSDLEPATWSAVEDGMEFEGETGASAAEEEVSGAEALRLVGEQQKAVNAGHLHLGAYSEPEPEPDAGSGGLDAARQEQAVVNQGRMRAAKAELEAVLEVDGELGAGAWWAAGNPGEAESMEQMTEKIIDLERQASKTEEEMDELMELTDHYNETLRKAAAAAHIRRQAYRPPKGAEATGGASPPSHPPEPQSDAQIAELRAEEADITKQLAALDKAAAKKAKASAKRVAKEEKVAAAAGKRQAAAAAAAAADPAFHRPFGIFDKK